MILARIGIGRIVAIDFDKIEISNLDRQILFDPDDVGQKKVEVVRKKILAMTGGKIEFVGIDKEVRSVEETENIIDGADLVLNPFSYHTMQDAFFSTPGILAIACHRKGMLGYWMTIPLKASTSACQEYAWTHEPSISVGKNCKRVLFPSQ